jgi:signal transduction histidine kinase
MTIRRKLITMQLITAAAVLVLASAVFVWSDLTTYRASLVSRLQSYAELIGDNTISSLRFLDEVSAAETLGSLSVAEGITDACIYDASGSVFATYSLAPQPNRSIPETPGEGHRFTEDALELFFPIIRDAELVGTIFVRSNLEAFAEKTREFAINAGLVLVVGLVLSFALSVMLQRTLSGRIEDLSDAARDVSESGRYDRRVPSGGTDELGVLSAGFNEMLEQIQSRDGELREARDTLEARVQERTEALEATRNEALRLASEAEAANKSKSVFLANVSHEIRTPMNAITGFAEILGGLLTDPRQKQYLASIQSSSHSLLELFSNIMDLSRLEAGDLDLNLTEVDLLKVFADTENVYSPKAGSKQLGFNLQLDPELPRSVALDESRFGQVLYNLLDNAIKFTQAGHISVDAKAIPDGGHVTLQIDISDTGIGIPEDQVEKVFAPFTQKQDQSINEYGGTGLGLTLTKRLLDAMGGQISVTSQVGTGSTFHIILNEVSVVDGTPIGDQTRERSTDDSLASSEESAVWSPESLTEAAREALPDLLAKMEEREATVASLAKTLTINEVDDFANWLQDLGNSCELTPVVQWADSLADQTAMFEIDRMGETLKSYPVLLDKVRSLI